MLEKRALVLDDEAQRRETLLQAASTWEEKVEDLTRAAQVYERVRASDPSNITASRSPRGDLPRSSTSGPSSSRSCSSARSCAPTSRSRSRSSTRSPRSTRTEIGDQESAFYVLQAAFKRDYSHDETANELERLATATNRWQELLDEYTNRVNELEREDRGAAADLWVKIGRWYASTSRHLEYAIHSVQQALRIDPATPVRSAAWPSCSASAASWSELIETLQRHAAVEPDHEKKTDAVHRARRAARAADAGHRWRDPRLPAGAASTTARRARRSPRSTGCTAAPSSGSR